MEQTAHRRIDEGVKRGPRRRQSMPDNHPDLGTWKIPANLDPHAVIDRYLSEATTSQIALSYNVSRKALVKWLRETVPEEWKQVQVLRALILKDDSVEGLQNAKDALSLARARELLRSGQWDLERLDAATFGPKQEVTHHASGPLIQINVAPIALGATVGATAVNVFDESVDNQKVTKSIR